MKFRHLSIKNFMWFVPAWIGADRMSVARALDDRLGDELKKLRHFDPLKARVPFITAIFIESGQIGFMPWDASNEHPIHGSVAIITKTPFGAPYILYFTLNFILRGCPSNVGTHTVYLHRITSLDTPLMYIGITKQHWADRFAQHINSARNGSPYLFHDAIRRHALQEWMTVLFDQGYDHEEAMTYEEGRVALLSLYPLGLNMIPGGYAGLRYLNKLGIAARNAEERDAALERLSSQRDLNGRPNPLCAARWASDQDYINRVICGRAGRLSVEQVRMIRLHSGFGRTPQEIASAFNLPNMGQVARAWSGKTYGRVQ